MQAIPGRSLARTASAIVLTLALVLAPLSYRSLRSQQTQPQVDAIDGRRPGLPTFLSSSRKERAQS